MGKALYRKHRSKSFDEVIGQSHITDTLKNALQKGAIAHAYLFTGPRGVGKTSIARILAHAINDLPYTDESTHLDIIEIDAASNRRIDEIRELRDKVHIAPTSAKYKVYIIDEVHMLTREAFNALLKTLEEPPEHVVFILATTEAHKIPDTIISRTQRFTFKPIDTKTAIAHLKDIAKREKIVVDDKALELIAQHGNGSFRDSISMLDQLSGLAKDTYSADDVSLLLGLPNEEVVEQLLQALRSNDSDRLFEAVRTMKEQGVDVNEAAKALSFRLRELIINKVSGLDNNKVILLLKELLPLTAGSADYSAFELSLLSAIDLHGNPQTAQPPQAQPPKAGDHPQPDIKTKEKKPHIRTDTHAAETLPETATTLPSPAAEAQVAEPNEASLSEDQDQPIAEFSAGSWNALLDDIKSHHNTLYGVLRMAEATLEEGKVVLRFSYGFHKKRIDSPQNSAIVRNFLKKHFGNAAFATTVSKASSPPVMTPPEASKPDASEAVSSVSNIFGGAELLES